MALPKVSVVMAVYNGEAYVSEAIESVLAQSFRDFEMVIIDDGSTDATTDILRRFETADDRIRVLRQKNSGQLAALNIGCGAAQGKYIARIDHDDVAFSDRFEKQVEFLDSHETVVIMGGGFVLVDKKGRRIRTELFPAEDQDIRKVLPLYNCFCHSTVMVRKETLQAVGGYRMAAALAEDYDLWCRMAEHGALANLPDPLIYRRVYPGQLSVANLRQQTLAALAIKKATEMRRTSGFDPLDDASYLDSRVLAEWGIDSASISSALAGAYLWWANLFLDIGDEETALMLASEAMSECEPKFLDSTVLAKIHWSAAKKIYATGRPARSLAPAWNALLMEFYSARSSGWKGLSILRTKLEKARPLFAWRM